MELTAKAFEQRHSGARWNSNYVVRETTTEDGRHEVIVVFVRHNAAETISLDLNSPELKEILRKSRTDGSSTPYKNVCDIFVAYRERTDGKPVRKTFALNLPHVEQLPEFEYLPTEDLLGRTASQFWRLEAIKESSDSPMELPERQPATHVEGGRQPSWWNLR